MGRDFSTGSCSAGFLWAWVLNKGGTHLHCTMISDLLQNLWHHTQPVDLRWAQPAAGGVKNRGKPCSGTGGKSIVQGLTNLDVCDAAHALHEVKLLTPDKKYRSWGAVTLFSWLVLLIFFSYFTGIISLSLSNETIVKILQSCLGFLRNVFIYLFIFLHETDYVWPSPLFCSHAWQVCRDYSLILSRVC